MDNSKIELISPNFFIFIFNFASISKKWLKKWVKWFFLRFSWKFLYNLILIFRIQKSNSFFPNLFIFIFIFASVSQKCLSKWFSWKLPHKSNFDMENGKVEMIFPYFFIFIFIFASISQKVLEERPKKIFSDFHKNCLIT